MYAAGDVNAAGADPHPLTAEASPVARFTALPRPIIDGRATGFCKLIADRDDHSILGHGSAALISGIVRPG